MATQEWAEKLAKDEKAFVLCYINNTNLTLHLTKDILIEGKYDNPSNKTKKKTRYPTLEPGETLKFGIKGKKKEAELSHKWGEDETDFSKLEFIFSLKVPPGAKGKAAHALTPENAFNVKKTANWKVKPPQITVTLSDPSGAPAPAAPAAVAPPLVNTTPRKEDTAETPKKSK